MPQFDNASFSSTEALDDGRSHGGGGSVANLSDLRSCVGLQEANLALAKSYQATLANQAATPTGNSNGADPPASPGILLASLVTPQRSPRNSLAVPHKVQFVENKNLR